MVLECDMWCNKNLPHGMLIKFIQNNFELLFRYVG
jgi:hypothetical protein